MKYKKLGNSDLIVSSICMGCMGFGDAQTGQHSWTINENETRKIIKSALDLGINFFDTAPVYQNGTSEQFVGKALRDFAKRPPANALYGVSAIFSELQNGIISLSSSLAIRL